MELDWKVTYEDGSTVRPEKYSDIDRSKLLFFDLLSPDSKVLYRVHIDDKRKRLIWRRRIQLSEDGSRSVIYLVGWQMTVRGESVQSIMYVTDDMVFMSSGWEQGTTYTKPELYEFEKKEG